MKSKTRSLGNGSLGFVSPCFSKMINDRFPDLPISDLFYY